jgi:hypothetical protein
MNPKCRHIMPSGKQCRAYALRDEPFCYFHSRLRRAAKQRRHLNHSASDGAHHTLGLHSQRVPIHRH